MQTIHDSVEKMRRKWCPGADKGEEFHFDFLQTCSDMTDNIRGSCSSKEEFDDAKEALSVASDIDFDTGELIKANAIDTSDDTVLSASDIKKIKEKCSDIRVKRKWVRGLYAKDIPEVDIKIFSSPVAKNAALCAGIDNANDIAYSSGVPVVAEACGHTLMAKGVRVSDVRKHVTDLCKQCLPSHVIGAHTVNGKKYCDRHSKDVVETPVFRGDYSNIPEFNDMDIGDKNEFVNSIIQPQ